ncbi:HbrB-like-domain-containing protein [Schizophyllum commune]
MAGWPPSPRRSHEQSRGRRSSEDHPWPNRGDSKGFLEVETAPRKRSASTDGPRVAADGGSGKRFLSTSAAEAPELGEAARGPEGGEKERGTGPRGLGALADKLHAAHAHHHNRFHPAHFLHHHHHHSDQSSAMAASPAKGPYGRTYDSKLVTREMHRLGNLAHLPAGLTGAAAIAAPAVATANIPAPAPAASTSATDPWSTLHVHVLPLFNGEPLRIPIEDLNVLVKRHIQTVVSAAPSKALTTLEHDLTELIASGMVTLNAKLVGVDDDKLLVRVVEIWGFFWDQVLPYVEGVLLPLQTDPLLSSLYRTPKQTKASQVHRTSSPTRHHQSTGSASNLNSGNLPSIDVRTAALRAFRDRVIAPLSPRLHARIQAQRDAPLSSPSYQQPRLQQMLLVLSSQARARPQNTFSVLTAPPTPPSPAESAITDLLRALRAPHTHAHPTAAGAPSSFLAGGVPRDRRGRVGRRPGNWQNLSLDGADDTTTIGGLTPRGDREREFLDSLRSPDPEPDVRASVGGWGLGGGKEEIRGMEEDDDEPMDWDSAQAVVERMVGMNAVTPTEASTRRRPT